MYIPKMRLILLILLFPHAHIERWRLQQAVKYAWIGLFSAFLNDWNMRDSISMTVCYLWIWVVQSREIGTFAHSSKSRVVGVSGVNLRLNPDVRHHRFRLVRRVPAEPKEVFSDWRLISGLLWTPSMNADFPYSNCPQFIVLVRLSSYMT